MTNAQGNRGWAALMIAAILTMVGAAIAAPAQTFTLLLSFEGADGVGPNAGLIQATDGNLYGTTAGGGANGYGTIFKMNPSTPPRTVHSFDSSDGAYPNAALVQGADGNFYGTTSNGGANNGCRLYGCGTIFKIAPGGALTTLYSFCAQSGCTDGYHPYASPLVQGADGDFYGTTAFGGANQNSCAAIDCGTVFKITTGGTLTTLHSFCAQAGCLDGQGPYGGLVQATDGNFYGITILGGANGVGTIFRITPSGTLTTFYSFCSQSGCADGGNAFGEALVQATDGSLYGTTESGGANGRGTVFEITLGGTLTTLYSFCAQSDCADGYNPRTGLIQGTDGDFYGVTQNGGNSTGHCEGGGCGTLFKITPGGTLTTLHSFDYTDGEYPEAVLVQDTNGDFYGTTPNGGGAINEGTLFSLSVGLGPFVETEPTFGEAENIIKILGTDLTGATSVTFNGTPAAFKVVSPSLIGATIPTGATTGSVQVVTPKGTLTSNVNFQVLP